MIKLLVLLWRKINTIMYIAFIPLVSLVSCQGTMIILWPRIGRVKSVFDLTKVTLGVLEA